MTTESQQGVGSPPEEEEAPESGAAPEPEVPPAADARIKKFFENVGIVVTSLIVFFLLAELITRTVDAIATDATFFGQTKYYALYDEHPFMYRVPRPGATYGDYNVNSKGFRGREFDLPKPKGTYRILTLGGSAVWCTDVKDDETWQAKLEDRLRESGPAPAVRYEVINGGVPGYTSAESYMNFVWRGLPLQLDAVLVYQGYNDFKPNRWPGEFKADYSHFRKLDHGVWRSFAESSHFVDRFRTLLGKLRPAPADKHDQVTEPGLQAFQDNLRRIVVTARAYGIQPLLATYAMSVSEANFEAHYDRFENLERFVPNLSPAGIIQAHGEYNRMVRELGAELGVPVLDISAIVPKDFDHFKDHCHLTIKGTSLVAEHMARVLPGHLKPVEPPEPDETEPVDPPAPTAPPGPTGSRVQD